MLERGGKWNQTVDQRQLVAYTSNANTCYKIQFNALRVINDNIHTKTTGLRVFMALYHYVTGHRTLTDPRGWGR